MRRREKKYEQLQKIQGEIKLAQSYLDQNPKFRDINLRRFYKR